MQLLLSSTVPFPSESAGHALVRRCKVGGLSGVQGIDIEQFFNPSEQSYFFKKRFGYWEIDKEPVIKKRNVAEDDLVKVIHKGRVMWFTPAEARRLLEDCEDEGKSAASFKANLEKALRGSSRSLADEIRVLFNLAIATLSQRIEEGIVKDEQAEDMTNSLRRRFEIVEENIEELLGLEKELTERKRSEPIFASYEKKLAEFMRLQKSGETLAAAALAKQLVQEKKHYVIRSRSLEPLTYAAYYYRLDLQKLKGRVLDTQRQLCDMRDSIVQHELQQLRKSAGAQTDNLFEDPEELKLPPDSEEIKAISRCQKELRNLSLESKVLVETVKEVDKICDWIEKEIFKDENLKNAAVTHANKRKSEHTGANKAETRKKGTAGGMVVMDRIQKKGRLH
ncbi:MAG: hypothetical protein ABIH23_07160 [bacterium]